MKVGSLKVVTQAAADLGKSSPNVAHACRVRKSSKKARMKFEGAAGQLEAMFKGPNAQVP